MCTLHNPHHTGHIENYKLHTVNLQLVALFPLLLALVQLFGSQTRAGWNGMEKRLVLLSHLCLQINVKLEPTIRKLRKSMLIFIDVDRPWHLTRVFKQNKPK